MKSCFKFLLVVNILLLIFDIQSFAQDPIDQYPGIPLVIYPNRRVQDMIDTHPNSLNQIKQMGVYGTIAPDIFDSSVYLDSFRINGIKVLPAYTWGTTANLQDVIWRYTNSHYTIWEAEGTDLTKGLATLYHNSNMPELTEGNAKSVWTNNTTIPAGTVLINGPGYPQNATYNYSSDTVNYTAEYRMKISRRLPSTLPQNYQNDIVCKILVTNRKDGGYPEETVDSFEVKVSDLPIWGNWENIPLEYDLRDYIPEETQSQMGSNYVRLPRGSAYFVQFKVIWYGLEYLNLYIDRVRISDARGRELMEQTQPTTFISTLVNNYISNSSVVGWYGTDEPGSIDNYEPYRIVDNIIYAASLQYNKPLRLHAAITGSWQGTYASSSSNYGMAHEVFVADEFWLRANPKNIQINTYMYHTPWRINDAPDYIERNIYLLTDIYYGKINNYDTSFAVSTQAGAYYFYNDNCTFDHSWIIPSTNQLNYQVNLSLLYGARELRLDPFFSNYSTCGNQTYLRTSGLIDINEQETDNYIFYKETIIPRLNGSFGKELKKIHQVEQFPNQQLPILQPINSSYNWVKKIEYYQGDAIPQPDYVDIGFFETHFNSGDVPYFMVVNRWYNTTNPGELLKISIDKTGTGYTNWNVTNFIENTNQTIVNSGFVTMPHIPGEARLFKVYPVLKDGGSLVVNETTHPNDILLGDMSIESGATLTINGTYNAKANIIVKTGGKIIAGTNGKIIFGYGKQLIIDGSAEIKGTSSANKLALQFSGNNIAVLVKTGSSLIMNYCNITGAYQGINTLAGSQSYVSISNSNILATYSGISLVGGSQANGSGTPPTPTIQNCNITASISGINVSNYGSVLLKANTFTNCGITVSNVASAFIQSNNISLGSNTSLPGIFFNNSSGYIRSNTIKNRVNGIQIANSSPDCGGNLIENNYKHGLYIAGSSIPNLVGLVQTNPPTYYPLAGYNTIRNNGNNTTSGGENDGSEIYFSYSDAHLGTLTNPGCNQISDDRTATPSMTTIWLLSGIYGNEPHFLDAIYNYWGTITPTNSRFGIATNFSPFNGSACSPGGGSSELKLVLKTSSGEVVDSIASSEGVPENFTTLESSYSEADNSFATGNITIAKPMYEQIVQGNYTSTEKLSAYNKLYAIGNLTGEDETYFTSLQTTFEDIASNEADTLIKKVYEQNAIKCDVSNEEFLIAINKFDNIIQQNPNSEEAVYAEIDIITTALNLDTTNSGLGKFGGGKYLVKGTSDYLSKLNDILQSKFGINSEEGKQIIPKEYSLHQNYPNPFNPSTTIKFDIPDVGTGLALSNVTLKVYDILGREVATLVDEFREAGVYEITFDASKLASGVYVYKLQAGDFVSSKKMILLK